MITTLVPFPIVHVSNENDYNPMIPEQEIKDWWEKKIANYLQNYTRRNKMSIAQARENFLCKTHENFVQFVLCALKKLLDEKYGR